ncbi:MAG: flagellar assembly protein FliW [Ilumatobacter sp.]|uniref:flagellar assembly protein FliW n=1 Tax=Ilumatobacter sp. TaxID=1967498 RepID=UPI00260D7EF5|nr:flagellar assembly protein FliW [Ilumatobacter sp.]MDJ0767434.1 flagellar assembly protein FliW [Ilumatobacter sp.]
MQIETSRFGTVEVPEDELVTFDDGVPGFPGRRRMAVLGGGEMPGGEPGEGHHTLFWLQDVTDPDLAFMTIVPWAAYPDYDVELEADEGDDVSDADDLCVLVVVTVRREEGGIQLTSNLLAPIVIDTALRRGRQVILQDQTWPVRAPLARSLPAASEIEGD